MRIAFFTEVFLPKVDGIVNTMTYLLRYLEERGHQAIVFAPEGGSNRFGSFPVVRLPGRPFPLYPELTLISPAINVESELLAFQPDLVHLVNPIALGLAGLRHANRLELPVVASYHTDVPGFAEQWGLGLFNEPIWAYLRWIHNQADLNLCPSHETMTMLQEHDFWNLKLWTRGVDTDRFHPEHRSMA